MQDKIVWPARSFNSTLFSLASSYNEIATIQVHAPSYTYFWHDIQIYLGCQSKRTSIYIRAGHLRIFQILKKMKCLFLHLANLIGCRLFQWAYPRIRFLQWDWPGSLFLNDTAEPQTPSAQLWYTYTCMHTHMQDTLQLGGQAMR